MGSRLLGHDWNADLGGFHQGGRLLCPLPSANLDPLASCDLNRLRFFGRFVFFVLDVPKDVFDSLVFLFRGCI